MFLRSICGISLLIDTEGWCAATVALILFHLITSS